MRLSWKHYLSSHASAATLNENASNIQKAFHPIDNPTESFQKLCQQPNLVVLSKSPIPNEVQASFLHTRRFESILQTKPHHNALTGFGARATAVKLNPVDLFTYAAENKVAPSMPQFLNCTETHEFKQIPSDNTNSEVRIPVFAVLPPFLADHIYDIEDWNADNILLIFVNVIKEWRTQQLQKLTTNDTTGNNNNNNNEISADDANNETTNNNNINNNNSSADDNMAANEALIALQADDIFHNILIFLWGIIIDNDTTKPVHLSICPRALTEAWADEQHQHLLHHNRLQHPSTQSTDLSNVANQVGSLVRAINSNNLTSTTKTTSAKDRGMEAFDRLPLLHRNTILLFSMAEEQDQHDVENTLPNPNLLNILQTKSHSASKNY